MACFRALCRCHAARSPTTRCFLREIELLRELELDYLLAHHELMWELLSKQTLVRWKLFAKHDGWPLHGAFASRMDISIGSLFNLERIGPYESQQSNLVHRFLREWRNLYHHHEPILFEPYAGMIRLDAEDSSEPIDFPEAFDAFRVVDHMHSVKKPQNGLRNFLRDFGIVTRSKTLGQLSTLSGAIGANRDVLLAVIKDAYRRKWESLPPKGVRMPGFAIGSAFLTASNHAAIRDKIWKASADIRIPSAT